MIHLAYISWEERGRENMAAKGCFNLRQMFYRLITLTTEIKKRIGYKVGK